MEDIIGNLAEKYQEDIYPSFTEDEIKVAREDFEGSFMVKLIGGRGFKRGIFTSTFKKLWGQSGYVTFSEVEDNTLMAKFSSDADRERALSNDPWLHMGWAVQVARWIPRKQLEELFTDKIHLAPPTMAVGDSSKSNLSLPKEGEGTFLAREKEKAKLTDPINVKNIYLEPRIETSSKDCIEVENLFQDGVVSRWPDTQSHGEHKGGWEREKSFPTFLDRIVGLLTALTLVIPSYHLLSAHVRRKPRILSYSILIRKGAMADLGLHRTCRGYFGGDQNSIRRGGCLIRMKLH